MKLLIISHTPHYYRNSEVVGWGATTREIDHLACLFSEIFHIAPIHQGNPSTMDLPYRNKSINLVPVSPAGGDNIIAKLKIFLYVPRWIATIRKYIKIVDAIHIRCPANISLTALFSVMIWAKQKPIWVKYAGNWDSKEKSPLSYRIQRYILKKNFIKSLTTINGSWPEQPDHIISFNNPSLTQKDYELSCQTTDKKQFSLPIQLLFVGRLDSAKGVDRLLQISKILRQKNIDFKLTLVGDSPERRKYELFVKAQHLEDQTNFTGWKPFSELRTYYQQAHLFIFPSLSEGWPKVISEAMAFGVVPIASSVGSIPQTLYSAGVGKSFHPDEIEKFVDSIIYYSSNPQIWKSESIKANQAAANYSYEYYLDSVKRLFKQGWNIELSRS